MMSYHATEQKGPADRTFEVLHYAYPIILLFFFLFAFSARSIAASKSSQQETSAHQVQYGPGGKPLPVRSKSFRKAVPRDFSPSRKLLFEWLTVGVCFTFVGNCVVVIWHALYARHEHWWCGEALTVYIVGSFFSHSLLLISLLDSTPSPTIAQFSTWSLALSLELVLFAAGLLLRSGRKKMDRWYIAEVAVNIIRLLLLSALTTLYLLFTTKSQQANASASESTTLLDANGAPNGAANGNGNGNGVSNGIPYGTIPEPPADEPGWARPMKVPSRSWWEYIKGYSVFFPYLWPSKDRKLQIMVLLCIGIVALQRVINVLVPYQVGVITDKLSGDTEAGHTKTPWGPICLYIFYRLMQGNNGLLGAARSTLWIPVSQYSYRALSVAGFEHVHSLSLDFHLGKKTGEVLSALGKGSSINTFLEQVTFNVVPMVVDLVVAIAYFLTVFDAYYALIITVITFWYIYLTIRMAQWRADIRRDMVNADREEDAVKNDSMVSYETVKYFNAEEYEFNRYKGAVKKYQDAEYKVLYSLQIMNVTQNMIFMLGLMVACFLAAFQVTTNKILVGKFVSLLTYMAQLQQPLNYFGTFYRMIQSSLINSERMLELFKENPTVVDKPEATILPSSEGDIRFDDVHFAYDKRKEALRGLSFHCEPGTTTAFVGESGGGKSTVFRLLFRFYNAHSGSILMDGHDVEDLTIDSVRRHIGVVPQDTVLFNETLMYNLKYAKPDATDEEVFEACRAASIHDKILGFPDGYLTKVGDRGLRLSGGEKQRVAIARTIIKGPRVIMLDEATAALDTETEQHIQDALTTLGEGRTMIVIAHRLSTITRADQILVLHEGKVAERGTHEELLALGGRYKSMWKKQIRAERVAEEAKVLQNKAERLRRESKDGVDTGEGSSGSSPTTSEGEHDHKPEQSSGRVSRGSRSSRGKRPMDTHHV